MKILKKLLILTGLMVLTCSSIFAASAKFNRGVNLSKWFESWEPGIPNLKVYDKSDFEHLKELGCDVVRVPIHFANFLDDDGKIDPVIFEYLDKACDWAEELGMYIVIDNHSFNSGAYPSPSKVEESLKNVWTQVAKRYKKRSNYIIYEILNEPQFKNADWEPIQKNTLAVIRKIDKKHTVVVTGADWSGIAAMCNLAPLNDKNIIYTFHFYEPMVFTHQGADWGDAGLAVLKNIPFPYNADKMPEIPSQGMTSTTRMQLASYPKTGNAGTLKASLKRAADFSEKVGAPVWCGELGVHDVVVQNEERNNWYASVGKILADFNIPFTVWGYDDTFGIFTPHTKKVYPNDLNAEVLTSLGMNVPEGVGESVEASSDLPLVLYDDFFGKGVTDNTWSTQFYITNFKEDPSEGSYCIMTGLMDRYGAISFDLSNKSLGELKTKKDSAYICFDVKFTNASQGFQLRFVDNDNGLETEIPYRLSYDVKASDYELNKWNTVEIKIGSMNDWGGWSNITEKWYDSHGDFSFDRISSLELAAEEHSVVGRFYLDNMKIILK